MGSYPGYPRPGCIDWPRQLPHSSPPAWPLGSGFWLEPWGVGPGHSCPFQPLSSLPHLHPGSCLLASVCLSGCLCVCLIFSASLILFCCHIFVSEYLFVCGWACLLDCQGPRTPVCVHLCLWMFASLPRQGRGLGSNYLAGCARLLLQVCICLSVCACSCVCVCVCVN